MFAKKSKNKLHQADFPLVVETFFRMPQCDVPYRIKRKLLFYIRYVFGIIYHQHICASFQ